MEIKQYENYLYEIKNNHIMITEYQENTAVMEIPEQIHGMPVTELGEYLFSGKDCETVSIPPTVEKIGRYGFYNCRKLKELSFGSRFLDIGSGAFTGCHHINRISVKMEQEESGLKEVLSEVREELMVHLTGIYDAVLWFPEFYEEGVENTPARILMTQVHGSGLYYRNCFQGKKFNFLEYDSRFEMARAQESFHFLMELVYGRLRWPEGLNEKGKNQYEEYLTENYQLIALAFVKEKRTDALEWLLNTYPIQAEQKSVYDQLLDAASQNGTVEMTSMLMEYGRRRFPSKRKSFDL